MVPPLLRVVLPLVLAAIVLSVVFARLFPAADLRHNAPAVRFTDVTLEAGIEFRHFAGVADSPTTLGAGVTVFDFDADGDSDIFFVNGAPWPWEETMTKRVSGTPCALFRNEGRGQFTDVTARAGLNVELQGMTAAAGDFDGDGWVDLFVTCVGANHLFRNRGGGRFEDVTDHAGVGGDDHTWSTGAAWLDYDGDRRPDLIVAHYAHWSGELGLASAFAGALAGRSYGAPTSFVSAFPSVYRNLGHGKFALVPGSAGLRDVDAETGLPVAKPLAVVPVDANGDQRLDVLFSYHTSENALFLNRGDGTFRKGAGGRDERREGASAGIPSGLEAAAKTDPRFAAWQAMAGVAARERDDPHVQLRAKFGAAPLDYDLDGGLELFSAEGRAERDLNLFDRGRSGGAAPGLFWWDGTAWRRAFHGNGDDAEWSRPMLARGVAVGDFDGDGDPDVILAQHGGAPRLLRNDQRLGRPWLRIQLLGTRGGVAVDGARVEVHTPRGILAQTAGPAMGFMAQSEAALTFGLGEDARVRKIVVYWPTGARQEIRPVELNRLLVVREP